VLAHILAQTGKVLALGIVIGVPLSWVGTKLVKSLLYGVTPFDPVTIAGAVGILTLIALVGSAVPALRASRIQPMEALRHE
jgi:putative ABC transport system permease protein